MKTAQNQPLIPAISATGFVRLPNVLAVFPVSRSTWLAGVKSGKYPQPVKLAARCTAWRAEDILALIEAASGKNEVA